MKIEIERSGGFTGIVKKIGVDTQNLPKEVADNIEKKVHDAILFNPPKKGLRQKMKGSADFFVYRVSIQEGKKRQLFECTEFDMNENLSSIIKSLEKKLKKSQ